MEHTGQGGLSSVTVVSKICHTVPDGSHCTHPGVSCGAMDNRFAFDSIILVSEVETDKDGRGVFFWSCGGGWGCLFANIELYVPELERCGDCVSASLAALSRL